MLPRRVAPDATLIAGAKAVGDGLEMRYLVTKCVFLEGENMSLSAADEASLKRYQGEIDRGKKKVTQLELKIAQEKVAIAAKTAEYNRKQHLKGIQQSTLQSLQRDIDARNRNIASYEKSIASENAAIARSQEAFNRVRAKAK